MAPTLEPTTMSGEIPCAAKRVHHADLNGAKAASAGQHERRFLQGRCRRWTRR